MSATCLVAGGMLFLGVIDVMIWNIHALWIDLALMAVGVAMMACNIVLEMGNRNNGQYT